MPKIKGIHITTGGKLAAAEKPIDCPVTMESGTEFHGSVAAGATFTRVATDTTVVEITNGATIVSGGEIGLITMARNGSTIIFTEPKDDVHIVAPADEAATIGDAAAAPADLA